MAKNRKSAKIPGTMFGRATKLIGTGVSMVSREVAHKIVGGQEVNLRVRQAKDLVQALSQLKGAAMKVGQFLSLELSDLLPPQVTKVLRQLHDDSSMMPFAKIEKILKSELRDRYSSIDNLSTEPLASASIGQVHTAEIDGKAVAIKIQFPGIAKSIDSDLKLLRKLVDSFIAVRGKKTSFDAVFTELRASLKLEVDYLKEAEALVRYRNAFSDLEEFCVPEVFTNYTTKRVLTLSFETGLRISEFLELELDETRRHAFGHKVLRLLLAEFFQLGLVQTDPNYGNFLVRSEDDCLILLDFGATKQYEPEFRDRVRQLLKLAMLGDPKKLIRSAEEFGLLDPRESKEVKAGFCELMETIVFIFRPENQPFCFADTDYLTEIRTVALAFANAARYTAPASHLIFLNRKLGGMFHLLKDLDCTIDLAPYWKKVMKMKFT